jgi:hypothetical protein
MTFALDLAAFMDKAGGNAEIAKRKIAIEVARSLIEMSPVDTGRFRANWQVGIGKIDETTTEETDKVGGSTLARLTEEIGSPIGPSKSRSTYLQDSVIFITNNLPYAQALEDGHSKQAPNGMVKITVARFQEFVDRAVASMK